MNGFELMDELKAAHEDYLKRKKEIIDNLTIVYDTTDNQAVKRILLEAIDFINEKEV